MHTDKQPLVFLDANNLLKARGLCSAFFRVLRTQLFRSALYFGHRLCSSICNFRGDTPQHQRGRNDRSNRFTRYIITVGASGHFNYSAGLPPPDNGIRGHLLLTAALGIHRHYPGRHAELSGRASIIRPCTDGDGFPSSASASIRVLQGVDGMYFAVEMPDHWCQRALKEGYLQCR